ncbi:MAG: hypothetical protein L0Y54_22605 [Sporichthyaceae bacterium]|nr:hypothetical protein [Sporichthyaceae bacterium]
MIGHRLFTSLVLVLSLFGLSSCGPTDGPTAPSNAPEPSLLLGSSGGLLGTGVGTGLLSCTPLPYARTEQVVGPAGGTIVVGPHRLVVPAGALAEPVLITAEAPSDSVASVRLLPHGLTFAAGRPARLTLSYANCSLLGQLLPKRVVYTTDLLEILEWLLSIDEPLARRVSTNLDHFSRYAVAW